jgi:hypothetical protein
MPEFMLDIGSQFERFAHLDKFTVGYLTAMFWTESGESNSPCEGATLDDLSEEAWKQAQDDCADFNLLADAWLHKAYTHGNMSYDMERAGIDFWLSRNGHGAGYFDRDIGTAANGLQKLARSMLGRNVYRGNDGLIYYCA